GVVLVADPFEHEVGDPLGQVPAGGLGGSVEAPQQPGEHRVVVVHQRGGGRALMVRSNSPAAGSGSPGGGSSARWISSGMPADMPWCFTSPWVGESHRSTCSTMLPSAAWRRKRTVSGKPGRGAGPTGWMSRSDHFWVGKAKYWIRSGLKDRAASMRRPS